MVEGCPGGRATWLGVCAEHWEALPAGLRRRWQEAWFENARTREWAKARRECVEYLSGRAA